MKATKGKNGDIIITCHKQHVLTICETSDEDTINLFLIPINSDILETDSSEYSKDWTHELLSDRTKESKKNFADNEPCYQLIENEKKNVK